MNPLSTMNSATAVCPSMNTADPGCDAVGNGLAAVPRSRCPPW